MVSSTAGFILNYDSGQKTKSEGKTFLKSNNLWLLKQDNSDYYFYYLPEQVKDYKDANINSFFYLKANLTDQQLNRLSYNLALSGIKFQVISSEPDCSDTMQTVILGTEAQNVYKDGNCLFLQGDADKSIDVISYNIIYKNG